MPKPRRRRRFFALEGRFEVGDSGEMEGIAEEAPAPVMPDTSTEGGSAAGVEASVVLPESDETAGGVDLSPDPSLPPAFRPGRSSRGRAVQRRVLSRGSLLLALFCLVAGALASRWWPQAAPSASVEAPANSRKPLALLTPADEGDLDAAYAARQRHDYAEATRIFKLLQKRHPNWGPLEVEFGRTLFYANDSHDASAVLRTAVAKDWKPAEANFLLGMLNKIRGSYPEAEASFARAVAIDPTSPDYYFFWGECLREQGKLLDAMAKFRAAQLRNQYETASGLYRAKLWLCAIEAERPASDPAILRFDAALAQAHPPMEALIAAAAREIKAGTLGPASVHLSRARRRADPAVFQYLINDPLFVPVRTKAEFAAFFPTTNTPSASPPPEQPAPTNL